MQMSGMWICFIYTYFFLTADPKKAVPDQPIVTDHLSASQRTKVVLCLLTCPGALPENNNRQQYGSVAISSNSGNKKRLLVYYICNAIVFFKAFNLTFIVKLPR